jgi:hypothetical protein
MANGWTAQAARTTSGIHLALAAVGATNRPEAMGKFKASQNAYKGGTWWLLRELSRALRGQQKA